MKHVVMVEKSDHVHVLGDYSGSPFVAKMTEAEWELYYATSDDMQAMRESQKGSVAAMIEVGAGLWKKDWSGPYVPAPPPDNPDVLRLRDFYSRWDTLTSDEQREALRLVLKLAVAV